MVAVVAVVVVIVVVAVVIVVVVIIVVLVVIVLVVVVLAVVVVVSVFVVVVIKTTEVLLQPKPGCCYKEPAVMIGSDSQLKAVTTFFYVGGVLSNDYSIDLEIVARLAKASSTFALRDYGTPMTSL